jgi:hypothetical protein
MKNIFPFSRSLAMVLLATLLFMSCSKTGPQGPAGSQGAQGEKGDQGAVGPAGKDGSILYSGTSTPSASVGKDGDYYLDKTSGALFGPKTVNGWGTAINLKGQKGDNGDQGNAGTTGATGSQGPQGDQGATGAGGKNGSQILSGDGAPGSATGGMGDFYLDKTNILLYGPKQAASNWGPALMLKGKDGNADVKAYLLTNPYDYLNPNRMGAFDISANTGNFNLAADVQNNHLISVYVKGSNNSMFPANQEFQGSYNCTNFFDGGYLYIRIYKDDGSDWAGLDAFKQLVNLTDFLVFDIAPSAIINISRKGYTPAQRHEAVQQIVKLYLK